MTTKVLPPFHAVALMVCVAFVGVVLAAAQAAAAISPLVLPIYLLVALLLVALWLFAAAGTSYEGSVERRLLVTCSLAAVCAAVFAGCLRFYPDGTVPGIAMMVPLVVCALIGVGPYVFCQSASIRLYS